MSPESYKILYVEDNHANRVLVHRILTAAGYTVFEAEDGLSGIQVAERERPDLILMDIMLPGMDGHQVTTRLKSLPEMAKTPIVALTAKSLIEDRDRALIAGCDGFIPKPVDVDRLPDQIAEFLAGKREEIQGDAEDRLTLQQAYTRELVIQLEDRVRELQQVNQELRHTDELKSKFIAMASHELRTPLAVIHGYLSIFKATFGNLNIDVGETALQSLSGIDKGVQRLRDVIEEMLDVVRIEGKTLQIHPEPVAVSEYVRAAAREFQRAAKDRQLTIAIAPMDDLPTLHADKKYLHLLFSNLLSNAIKFTPDGGRISILAQVTKGSELERYGRSAAVSGDFVHLIFSDTGIGIAPEEHERIFDLFYEVRDVSLHSTSKTSFMGSGLGLGLAIARGVVEAHEGILWVESEGYDREKCPGSRFHILLPLNVKARSPAA